MYMYVNICIYIYMCLYIYIPGGVVGFALVEAAVDDVDDPVDSQRRLSDICRKNHLE